VPIVVERGKLVYIIPDVFVVGVEYVRPVLVYVDACIRIIFGITVTGNVFAFFNYSHTISCPAGPFGHYTTKKPASDYNEVEFIEHDLLYY
jgi:hypothetical protein